MSVRVLLCLIVCAGEPTGSNGSSSDEAVLFRASEGDSVFLFCKDLISSTIQATWFWRSHSNHSFNLLSNSAAHIQNRLQYSNKNNDYSLSISNIQWDDSGRYECRRSSEPKQTFFELVVVRVRAEPQQLTEGDNVKLHCDVSYRIPHIKLYWINKETQKNFQNPHQLGNVNMGQRNWTCAVFTGSTLKALIPLTLNITLRPTTTTTSSSTLTPHCHTSDESKTQLQTYSPRTTRGTDSQGTIHHQNNTILIITGFSFILVVVLAGVCWRKRTKKNLEAEGPTCVQDSITYAAVSFRQKSENSKIVEDPCLRDSVTYAEVSFRQKSGDVSSECEPVSVSKLKVQHSPISYCFISVSLFERHLFSVSSYSER
ncbi:hypothetical protein NFI96_021954 [Prochilodus magdalenae]|nr:hypothetical protein NFI96_021954 [Prochilodus magdalenae]